MAETITYQGKIVEVVEFPSADGKKIFEKARRAPGVRLIIPIGEDSLLLTKEYRQETGGYDFRLPGGKVFDSLEEYNKFLQSGVDILNPATIKAKEEGKEEVGIDVKELDFIYTSILGATMQWDLLYFVVKEYKRGEQALEQGEDIEVVEITRDEAAEMCLDGRISEERSALVLLRYLTGKI
jgi:hypothetical protein